MGMLDSIRAGYAQGKREAEEEAIVKRHMREREKRKAALKPSKTAKKLGRAAQKLKPVGSAVSSSAKKLHEWNESHSPGGGRKKSAGAKKKKTTKKTKTKTKTRSTKSGLGFNDVPW